MKRFFLLLTVTVLLLSACTAVNLDEYSYTETVNGTLYTVTPSAGTVSDGTNVYRYTKSDASITVIYPNGAQYTTTEFGGKWNNKQPEDMAPVDVLIRVISSQTHERKQINGEVVVIAAVSIVLGLFYAIFPKIAWFIRHGWTYKNPEYAEPSDGLILFGRITGVVFVIVGIVLMVGAYQ